MKIIIYMNLCQILNLYCITIIIKITFFLCEPILFSNEMPTQKLVIFNGTQKKICCTIFTILHCSYIKLIQSFCCLLLSSYFFEKVIKSYQ